MRCVDVNVLVYAHRADLPEHDDYRPLLEEFANDHEPLGLPDSVLGGFLRVVTNRRVFVQPTSPGDAWQAIDDLVAAPTSMVLLPGARHWGLVRRLADSVGASGNDLPDAYLAAYAVENNATWLSADRGFAKFNDLRWKHPLAR